MNASVAPLPPAPPAEAEERLLARILFIGGCVLVLPAAVLTLYSLILIYLVAPVLVTGLLNWGGWWLLLAYRKRGWDRPMQTSLRKLWITSAVFNGVPFVGMSAWYLASAERLFRFRALEDSLFALAAMIYLLWLAFATAASVWLARQAVRAATPTAEVAS